MVARILTALSILTIVGSFVCLGTQGGGAQASQLAAQKRMTPFRSVGSMIRTSTAWIMAD